MQVNESVTLRKAYNCLPKTGETIKPEELEKAMILINHRPRKSLDYKTPFEVFCADKSDADAVQI